MPPQNSGSSKGRKPAHQNEFAFKHNPKSKLTEQILAAPNVGVCRRCHDKIEWRKQYRKYKTLSQPSTCNLCKRRNVAAAYHTICTGCALSETAFRKMIAFNEAESGVAIGKVSISKTDDQEGETKTDIVFCKPQREHTKGFRVCGICCKAKALPDAHGISDVEQEIDERKVLMVQKLGRPLKLRESKAIERKVEGAREKEKQRAKEERRRLRDESGKGTSKADANNDINAKDPEVDDSEEKEASEGSVGNDVESDDEEDPFLKAIGGKEKILFGEAYQKQLLENQKQKEVE